MTTFTRRIHLSVNGIRLITCGPLASRYKIKKCTNVQSYLRGISTQEESPRQHPGFKFIREGKAVMSYAESEEVFYNRVQIFNRDFSILVIRHFIKMREEELRKNHKKKLEHYQGRGSDEERS